MSSHDTELKGPVFLIHVGAALGPYRPCRDGTRFDTNDFLHDTYGLGKHVVDIGLITVSNERSDLLG